MTTNNDLNVGLARLMGWMFVDDRGGYAPDGWLYRMPDWSGSLDALFGPGGPVEYARNKTWGVTIISEGREWIAIIDALQWSTSRRMYDPAEALATALHEAFMKEQGQ